VARRLSALAVLLAGLALAFSPAPAGAGVRSDGDEGAIVVIVGDVAVHRGETVDGVFVVNGDVRIAGRVDGDVTVLSGDAVVSGEIRGDLFTAGGRARLLPSARVTGDVRYGDDYPDVSSDARVFGDVEKQTWPDLGGAIAWVAGFVVWLAITLSAAALGALLLLAFPRAADAVEARSRERKGPLIAIGLAAAIALPIGAGIAAITLVGLPLAFLVLLALLPIGVVGYLASAWALGRRVLGAPRSRALSFLAGLAILRLLALVPIVGLLVGIAAAVFGLGLLCAAIGAARSPDGPEQPQTLGS
jgi:hypothetical protein